MTSEPSAGDLADRLFHNMVGALELFTVYLGGASDLERYHYGWSVVACLPAAMGDPGTAATGAVMRAATLGRYAREAGFHSVEVLPIQTDTWRFYRLIP